MIQCKHFMYPDQYKTWSKITAILSAHTSIVDQNLSWHVNVCKVSRRFQAPDFHWREIISDEENSETYRSSVDCHRTFPLSASRRFIQFLMLSRKLMLDHRCTAQSTTKYIILWQKWTATASGYTARNVWLLHILEGIPFWKYRAKRLREINRLLRVIRPL